MVNLMSGYLVKIAGTFYLRNYLRVSINHKRLQLILVYKLILHAKLYQRPSTCPNMLHVRVRFNDS